MIHAVVTDIEGTTTSVSFVYDVLFPYARKHLGDYIRCHAEDGHVTPYLNDVRLEAGQDLDIEGVISTLEKWIDEDRKATPLKALQGLVWEDGYRTGAFHGHLYEDAFRNLKTWHERGLALYVYSSGSIKAQQLLFGHSDFGDLNDLFSGYFDTTTGPKTEPASYHHIVEQLDLPADTILFLSDVDRELHAAQQAGMQTCWLVREKQLDDKTEFPQARNFDDVTALMF